MQSPLQKVIPARSKIESMTGGQGLVKRMSKAGGAGGMEKIKEDYPKWIFEQLRLEEEVKAKKDENIDKPNPSNPKEFDIDHKEGIIKI